MLGKALAGLGRAFRGASTFFYLVSHWGEISHEREEYRRQIRDREQWAATMLRNKDALYKIEMERASRLYNASVADASRDREPMAGVALNSEPA